MGRCLLFLPHSVRVVSTDHASSAPFSTTSLTSAHPLGCLPAFPGSFSAWTWSSLMISCQLSSAQRGPASTASRPCAARRCFGELWPCNKLPSLWAQTASGYHLPVSTSQDPGHSGAGSSAWGLTWLPSRRWPVQGRIQGWSPFPKTHWFVAEFVSFRPSKLRPLAAPRSTGATECQLGSAQPSPAPDRVT